MTNIQKAFLRGFWKTAMMMSDQSKNKREMDIQAAQVQQLISMMPMQRQQQLGKQLADKFGMKGQNFLMNPSAYLT